MRTLAFAPLLAVVAAVPSAARGDDPAAGGPPICGDTTAATLSVVDCLGIEAVPWLDESSPQTAEGVASLAEAAGVVQEIPVACRLPVEVVFYTANLWMDLAEAMATEASPCGQYYFSIPAITGDKSELRGPLQPALIRALGPRFHAMAEIHWGGWTNWVAKDPSRTWCDAGIEARQRMAEKNYLVELGDTWSINELPSGVRSGGQQRVNAMNFIRCLYDGGDGSLAPVKGNVFVVGLGQGTTNMSVYKPNVRNWLADSPFWTEMARSVRWWGQEAYAYPLYSLVPETSAGERARSVSDYLYNVDNLAKAGPDTIAVARDFLRVAHYPLGNAAWRYRTGFGDTMVPADTMQSLASLEEYTERQAVGGLLLRAAPFVGYAWAPNNDIEPRLPTAEFNQGTLALAQRLASAIRWTFPRGGGSPAGACGPPSFEPAPWCDGSWLGATFNGAWSALTYWED
jgi:hypothetical protein